MEALINFLEQYWGVSIVGSVTVGTLIVTAVSLIRFFIKNKSFESLLDAMTTKFTKVTAELKKSKAREKYLQARIAYNDKVTAATFKGLSYLIMASKLDTKDKLELQDEFNKLLEETPTLEFTMEPLEDEDQVEDTPVEEETITPLITDTVEAAASLLDKYIGEK